MTLYTEVIVSNLPTTQSTGDSVYDLALQVYVSVEKLIRNTPASKKASLSIPFYAF